MDRYYESYDLTLRESVVETLLLWNTDENYNKNDFDFMFLQFLLIGVFGGAKIATGDMDKGKVQFAKDVFEFRVDYNTDRCSQFDPFITTIKDQFVRKVKADK